MAAAFLSIGIIDGGGGVLWSDVLDAFSVSDGMFGLASGIGIMIAFPIMVFGGQLADRFDKRTLLLVAFVFLGLASLGLTSGSGAVALTLLLVLRGVGFSLLDLANNALALDHERDTGRHVMSPLHAGFSAGTLLGAVVVWIAFELGGSFRSVYTGLVVAFALLGFFALWSRRRAGPVPRARVADLSPTLALHLLRRQEVRDLAMITGVCFCGELFVSQWVGIYLRDERGLSPSIGVQAVALYGGAMLVGRLCNGRFTAIMAPRRAIAAQGLVTALGGSLMAAGGPPGIAIAGCALAGLGLAGMAPTALSLVGAALPNATGAASGAVLVGGYAGIVVSPFAAGVLATLFSARAVMIALAVTGLIVIWVARRLPGAQLRTDRELHAMASLEESNC